MSVPKASGSPSVLPIPAPETAWKSVRRLVEDNGVPLKVADRVVDASADTPKIQRCNYRGQVVEDIEVPAAVFDAIAGYASPSALDSTDSADPVVRPRNRAFRKEVIKAQREIAEPIRSLRRQLGEIDKKITELLFSDENGPRTEPRQEAELSPEQRAQLAELQVNHERVGNHLAELASVGRVLFALRGERIQDRFGMMFIGSGALVPLPGVSLGRVKWMPRFAPRDPATGSRKLAHDLSLATFGVQKVVGNDKLGYGISLGWVYALEHPITGTSVGVSLPGVFFGGLAIRPNGNAAVEFGLDWATPLPVVVAGTGLMVEHPLLEPLVKPLVAPIVKGARWADEVVRPKIRSKLEQWGVYRRMASVRSGIARTWRWVRSLSGNDEPGPPQDPSDQTAALALRVDCATGQPGSSGRGAL